MRLFVDLINKLIPTERHTILKVFFINLLPFKLDKCAPQKPPIKEPIIKIINKSGENEADLLIKKAPIPFQIIPTAKNVKLIARKKSIPKLLINNIVTNKPVPEEIDPFNIPIKKIKIRNLNFNNNPSFFSLEDNPNSFL